MVPLAVAGFLSGAIAAATEILVLAPPDRPLTDTERSLRAAAATYVAGLATLGIILGVLATVVRPVGEPPTIGAIVAATGIVAGALGIAFTWRGRPTADRPELQAAQRTFVMSRLTAFQSIGVLGFLFGVIPIFVR